MKLFSIIPGGVTLDTGALVALERHDKRMRMLIKAADERGFKVTVPAPVVSEWWRNRVKQRNVLAAVAVEPTSERLAKIAGAALSDLDGPSAVHAIVMASAAQRGDMVFTSELTRMQQLWRAFPRIRIFEV